MNDNSWQQNDTIIRTKATCLAKKGLAKACQWCKCQWHRHAGTLAQDFILARSPGDENTRTSRFGQNLNFLVSWDALRFFDVYWLPGQCTQRHHHPFNPALRMGRVGGNLWKQKHQDSRMDETPFMELFDILEWGHIMLCHISRCLNNIMICHDISSSLFSCHTIYASYVIRHAVYIIYHIIIVHVSYITHTILLWYIQPNVGK